MFPNAKLDVQGIIIISPCKIDKDFCKNREKIVLFVGKTIGWKRLSNDKYINADKLWKEV